ncbi:hypothetical protein BCR44DRAFT_1441510 [Catenaria anguillulae PL171]|uniref:Transcription factor domain-containing protein n=1 Tax=Catenaria anguillulae PL171 TaxID=765915 RepID=A0A1Y2HBA9_9FUNG|nr:hypothetical protein BCR44DRAFT_1441510 [Catenaria anguillulae PL171]
MAASLVVPWPTKAAGTQLPRSPPASHQGHHNVIPHRTEHQTLHSPAYLPDDPHLLVHRYGHPVPIPFALAGSGTSRAHGRDYERQDARPTTIHSSFARPFGACSPSLWTQPNHRPIPTGALAHDAHHHQLYHDSPKYHGLPTHHPEAYCNGGDTNPFGGSEYPSGLDRQPSFGSPQRSYRLDHVRLAIHHYATSDLSALDPPSLRSWALSRPLDSTLDCAPPTLPEVSEWIALAAGTALTDMTACPETVLTLLLLTRAELLVGNIVSAWRLVGGAWTSVQLLRDFAAHQILDSDPLGKFPVDELVLAAVSMHLLVATILGTSPSLDLPTLACGAPMSPHDPIRASERDLTLAIASAVQFANSPNPQATVRSLVADIERCITACPEPLVFPPAAPNLLVASTASHVQAHATLIMLTRPAILRTLNLLPSSSSQPAARSPHGDVPAPRSPGEFEILFGAMSRSTGALVRVAQWISVQSAAQKQQALGRQSHDLPHHQSAAKSLLAALEVVSAASSAHASGSPSIVDRYLGTSDAIRVTNSSMGLPIPSPYRTPIAVPHTSNMRQPLAPNSDAARMHMDRSDWRMHGPAPGRLSETALAAGHLRPPPLPNSNSPSYSSSSAPRLSQPLTQSPPESLRPMLPPISSFLPKPDQISTAVNPNNGSAIRDTSSLSRSPPAAAPVGHASNGGVSHNGRQAESPGLAMLRMAAAAATMSDSGFDVRSLAATGDGAGGESRV